MIRHFPLSIYNPSFLYDRTPSFSRLNHNFVINYENFPSSNQIHMSSILQICRKISNTRQKVQLQSPKGKKFAKYLKTVKRPFAVLNPVKICFYFMFSISFNSVDHTSLNWPGLGWYLSVGCFSLLQIRFSSLKLGGILQNTFFFKLLNIASFLHWPNDINATVQHWTFLCEKKHLSENVNARSVQDHFRNDKVWVWQVAFGDEWGTQDSLPVETLHIANFRIWENSLHNTTKIPFLIWEILKWPKGQSAYRIDPPPFELSRFTWVSLANCLAVMQLSIYFQLDFWCLVN